MKERFLFTSRDDGGGDAGRATNRGASSRGESLIGTLRLKSMEQCCNELKMMSK